MNIEEKILQLLEKQGEMIGQINDRLGRLEDRMDRLESRMDKLEGRIDKLEASQTAMQATLDEHTAMLKKLDERSLKSAVLLETEVPRKFNLLYEGHSVIMENMRGLAEKSRVEALEDDVAIDRKSVV